MFYFTSTWMYYYFFALWDMLLDLIKLYIDLDIEFNQRILDLDLNQIVFLVELFSDSEQVTVNICFKIIIVIKISYMINRIRCSEKFKGLPVLGHSYSLRQNIAHILYTYQITSSRINVSCFYFEPREATV